MVRIATFNMENVFSRPTAMNKDDAVGRQAIEDHAELNCIIGKEEYSTSDKDRLIELCHHYKFHPDSPPTALVQLQKIRGQLFKTTKNELKVVATGRASWTGWFELKRDDVKWPATYNTGRVINEAHPDILITVEIEDRPTLRHFCEQVLDANFHSAYPHMMLIDGNDERGIDVGILSRFPIVQMESHVDDLDEAAKPLFSRDCPEYDIELPSGKRIVILANHLKSKRNGDDATSLKRRTAQAARAHEIAIAALNRSDLVLLGGDLNDTPDSAALAELFTDGFEDVSSHPSYPTDRPGTYGTGKADEKIDYLIMSPELRSRLEHVEIERRGSYHPRTWEPFDSVKNAAQEASDHHLVCADFAV